MGISRLYQAPTDLFGDVPITHADIAAWSVAVPRISPDLRRAAWYVNHHNATEKMRAAKLAGEFAQLTTGPWNCRRTCGVDSIGDRPRKV